MLTQHKHVCRRWLTWREAGISKKKYNHTFKQNKEYLHVISSGATANRKSTIVLGGNKYTLSFLSLVLEIFFPSLCWSPYECIHFTPDSLYKPTSSCILLDSRTCRLFLVLGWAQVPGWPNYMEGKDLHLMVGKIYLFSFWIWSINSL